MRDLLTVLSDLKQYVQLAEKQHHGVSVVNIGWHIEHSLLVVTKIIGSLCDSNPSNYRPRFNLVRTLIFFRDRFPRGRGKAPDEVKPKGGHPIDFDRLFSKAEIAVGRLATAHPNQYFEHPLFGSLNRKNTYILLDIHTRHHLNIIRDILSAA